MRKSKINVVFNYRDYLDKEGKGLISLKVYFSRTETYYLSTKIKVLPGEWNDKKKEIIAKNKNFVILNACINKMMAELNAFEFELISKGLFLNKTLLDKFISKENEDFDFISFCESEINSDKSVKHNTIVNRKQALNNLKSFAPGLKFSDINYSIIDKFNNYLISKGLSKNTIGNYHRIIKTYIIKAIKNDLITKNPYDKFPIKKEQTTKLPLNEAEVIKLFEYHFLEPRFEKVKDLFLFSCATGLRISDIVTLKKTDIDNGFIIKKMIKVSNTVKIRMSDLPFNNIVQNILEKYKGEFIFGLIENIENLDRKINKVDMMANNYLKLIGTELGFNKMKMKFHNSRHTFGTILAKRTGDIYKVMSFMGISRPDNAMQYTKLATEI